MKTYNRDELLDYLTAMEIGNHAEFETPDCIKGRYTHAWVAKRKFIDNWLTKVQNQENVLSRLYNTPLSGVITKN